MVFGNLGDTSATGVGFTRNPATGEKEFYGEFLMNAQGEDVVAGIRTPVPITELEDVHARRSTTSFATSPRMLEKHYRDMQDFEFTIQDGKLYMLQTRNGKRTGPAAVRIAVEMVEEGLITKEEAILRVEPQPARSASAPGARSRCARRARRCSPPACRHRPAPRSAQIVFTADEAVEASKKAPGHPGPQGNHAGRHSRHGSRQGHSDLARRHDQPRGGGRARHGQVPASRAPRSSLVERAQAHASACAAQSIVLKEGDWISLDGTTGEVFAGQANTMDADPSSGVLAKFMNWADEFRGKFGVRANADIPRDAKVARKFGAEGIGLCRTEHMFFAEDRIEHMQAMILADDEKDPPQGARRNCCRCSARISPACSRRWTASR